MDYSENKRFLNVDSESNNNGTCTKITPPIDHAALRYPYCLLWSPLPVISWVLPFIGHTGIADSNGIIFDFAGPYTIGKKYMAFGSPTKYLILDQKKVGKDWDSGVQEGCAIYSRRMHNLFFDNCHSHVARCLNEMAYDNRTDYGMLTIGVWMFFFGSFTSWGAVIRSYGPFSVICIICFLLFR